MSADMASEGLVVGFFVFEQIVDQTITVFHAAVLVGGGHDRSERNVQDFASVELIEQFRKLMIF